MKCNKSRRLNMQKINSKPHTSISTEEFLRDVLPFVLDGKVVSGTTSITLMRANSF